MQIKPDRAIRNFLWNFALKKGNYSAKTVEKSLKFINKIF